jgi:8-oxo-dGTP pyrophosphatase MutT (NUDIX family)
MKKWSVLGSTYLYKTKYGSLRTDRCLLPNGHIIEEYHVCEYADWVNCVAITPENEVVLVRQYRHGASDFFFEIPAGSAEEGESFEEAIARELKEETGYASDRPPIKLACLYTNPATNNNRVHSYLMTDVRKSSDRHLDATEEINVDLVPLDSIGAMISQGTINQLFSVACLHMATQYLRQG